MSSEGMNRIQNNVGELRLGVCSAYGNHFELPSDRLTSQKSIKEGMKNIEK